ncbi:hypothetical protein NDU88_007463 [Pleurodeles waltl]|uniref:Uncharacterized protein n=1 Tax=Pleurodeles waltl TaxID=8319 RepID=A0AAV7LS47_PLEWA|nr:hypothetical protein NDU88_007463 [Pleurodeles waltl]
MLSSCVLVVYRVQAERGEVSTCPDPVFFSYTGYRQSGERSAHARILCSFRIQGTGRAGRGQRMLGSCVLVVYRVQAERGEVSTYPDPVFFSYTGYRQSGERSAHARILCSFRTQGTGRAGRGLRMLGSCVLFAYRVQAERGEVSACSDPVYRQSGERSAHARFMCSFRIQGTGRAGRGQRMLGSCVLVVYRVQAERGEVSTCPDPVFFSYTGYRQSGERSAHAQILCSFRIQGTGRARRGQRMLGSCVLVVYRVQAERGEVSTCPDPVFFSYTGYRQSGERSAHARILCSFRIQGTGRAGRGLRMLGSCVLFAYRVQAERGEVSACSDPVYRQSGERSAHARFMCSFRIQGTGRAGRGQRMLGSCVLVVYRVQAERGEVSTCPDPVFFSYTGYRQSGERSAHARILCSFRIQGTGRAGRGQRMLGSCVLVVYRVQAERGEVSTCPDPVFFSYTGYRQSGERSAHARILCSFRIQGTGRAGRGLRMLRSCVLFAYRVQAERGEVSACSDPAFFPYTGYRKSKERSAHARILCSFRIQGTGRAGRGQGMLGSCVQAERGEVSACSVHVFLSYTGYRQSGERSAHARFLCSFRIQGRDGTGQRMLGSCVLFAYRVQAERGEVSACSDPVFFLYTGYRQRGDRSAHARILCTFRIQGTGRAGTGQRMLGSCVLAHDIELCILFQTNEVHASRVMCRAADGAALNAAG